MGDSVVTVEKEFDDIETASFTVLIPEISYVPQSTDMNVLKVTFNSERIIELPRKRGSGNAFDFFRQTRL